MEVVPTLILQTGEIDLGREILAPMAEPQLPQPLFLSVAMPAGLQ